MKKILFGLAFGFGTIFANCYVTFDYAPTCTTVNTVMSQSIFNTIKEFNNFREEYILKPTNELNTKLEHYNQINGEIYKEQKAMSILDNEMVRAVAEQKELLKQLAELKSLSVKLNLLSTKSELGDVNASK